jgi:hypothetical protein
VVLEPSNQVPLNNIFNKIRPGEYGVLTCDKDIVASIIKTICSRSKSAVAVQRPNKKKDIVFRDNEDTTIAAGSGGGGVVSTSIGVNDEVTQRQQHSLAMKVIKKFLSLQLFETAGLDLGCWDSNSSCYRLCNM